MSPTTLEAENGVPALTVDLLPSRSRAAEAAANAAAASLQETIRNRGSARILLSTGNSQLAMIGFLVRQPDIDWSKVEVFHLDEYVGLSASHPSSFRYWIRNNFAQKVNARTIHYMEGDAADLDTMVRDYTRELMAAEIDLALVGIGENGHIAFNDPHVADFKDPRAIKCVTLDEACRRQQVGEGHFPDVASVPAQAITLTCTGLFRAKRWICCVPDYRKAQAIKGTLEGPISTQCPGSLVQEHASVALFLDAESASLLSPAFVAANCRTNPSDASAASVN